MSDEQVARTNVLLEHLDSKMTALVEGHGALAEGLLDGIFDRAVVGDVQRERDRAATDLLDRGRGLARIVRADVADRHRVAVLRQPQGDRAADPAARTCDESDSPNSLHEWVFNRPAPLDCLAMDAYLAIVSKREVRDYADRPIEPDARRRILEAGRVSGSSANKQRCGRTQTKESGLGSVLPFHNAVPQSCSGIDFI